MRKTATLFFGEFVKKSTLTIPFSFFLLSLLSLTPGLMPTALADSDFRGDCNARGKYGYREEGSLFQVLRSLEDDSILFTSLVTIGEIGTFTVKNGEIAAEARATFRYEDLPSDLSPGARVWLLAEIEFYGPFNLNKNCAGSATLNSTITVIESNSSIPPLKTGSILLNVPRDIDFVVTDNGNTIYLNSTSEGAVATGVATRDSFDDEDD